MRQSILSVMDLTWKAAMRQIDRHSQAGMIRDGEPEGQSPAFRLHFARSLHSACILLAPCIPPAFCSLMQHHAGDRLTHAL
jgi:hypothetical protein